MPISPRALLRATALLAMVAAAPSRAALAADPAPAAAPPGPERVSLTDAVRRAMARNPSATVAAAEIERAEALLRQARAASLPSLSGTAIYTRLDHDRTLATGATTPPRVIAAADQLSANLQLQVPLFAPLAWSQAWRARDASAIAKASAAEVRKQVAIAAARAYLAVVAQHRVLEVAERARDTARAHFEFARARMAGGLGRALDEIRAQQEMATSEMGVQNARAALARAREALGVVVGADGPLDASGAPELGPSPSLAQALEEAAARRTDIRAGETVLRSRQALVDDRWVYYAPIVSALVQPFTQNPSTLTQPQLGWQAQLVLTLPLYDGGLRYGVARERRALLAEARDQLAGTLRQARAEVRTAFETLLRADDAMAAAREAASLAARALELANTAYRAGATSNLEVIDAERRARDADTTAAIAEDQARQARLDLLAASGRFPES